MEDTLRMILEQPNSEMAAREFREWLRMRTRAALLEVVEEEVTALCGPHHHPLEETGCYRAGNAPSSVYLGGERHGLKKPRVRRKRAGGSEEVLLRSWAMARDPVEWEDAMMRATLCGVSCRNVAKLRESEIRGESRSSLSRLWQRKAAALVDEVQQSDLSDIDLLALMIDGVVLCKNLVATVALAIDIQGRKRILGFQVGASENAEVCSDLLENLQRRGLTAARNRKLLAILDGSAALQKAVLKHFPGTLVQRCLVHKERNIRGYLSARHWKESARLFKTLRNAQGEEDALDAANEIECFLRKRNANALASLEEAGEDLLTLFRLEVPNTLHVTLLSTNAIENSFKNLRRHIGRVARWRQETDQADRWLASGLKLAEKTFRRIKGYADIPHLIKALEEAKRKEKAAEEAA